MPHHADNHLARRGCIPHAQQATCHARRPRRTPPPWRRFKRVWTHGAVYRGRLAKWDRHDAYAQRSGSTVWNRKPSETLFSTHGQPVWSTSRSVVPLNQRSALASPVQALQNTVSMGAAWAWGASICFTDRLSHRRAAAQYTIFDRCIVMN